MPETIDAREADDVSTHVEVHPFLLRGALVVYEHLSADLIDVLENGDALLLAII